ncbi:MAG: hypothetical protein SAJ12_05120 [Jaaginema sp. PMC 1079.18]|nr:hypothetical protein [Jaaginema sp. PMC 1080.18]MEC4850374.1 hypothetical protein [Jaaginema sp. PMC 1079.18]MEC4864994.1 hypothetical protein [Jaaginema sp. PMC 1078.18]
MESLAYTEIASIYEESVGDLQLRSITLANPRKLRRMASWATIVMAILLGGFTAALSTAFSDVNSPGISPQEISE